MCGPPATGGHTAASPGWRTLRSAPNCSLPPTSAISRVLFSQRAGDRASRRHLPPDSGALPLAPPREGRPMERGQRFTRPHPPTSHRPLPGGGSAAGRRPRAGCRLPRGAGPTPNPSGSPAPTHPGAGVGGCRVGSWSNRRGSSAPHTSWLQKARSRPS